MASSSICRTPCPGGTDPTPGKAERNPARPRSPLPWRVEERQFFSVTVHTLLDQGAAPVFQDVHVGYAAPPFGVERDEDGTARAARLVLVSMMPRRRADFLIRPRPGPPKVPGEKRVLCRACPGWRHSAQAAGIRGDFVGARRCGPMSFSHRRPHSNLEVDDAGCPTPRKRPERKSVDPDARP